MRNSTFIILFLRNIWSKLYNSRKTNTIIQEQGNATNRRSLYSISFNIIGFGTLKILKVENVNCINNTIIAITFTKIFILIINC